MILIGTHVLEVPGPAQGRAFGGFERDSLDHKPMPEAGRRLNLSR